MTRILLVEDDDILLENIALDLEFRGYVVTSASNGLEAVRILESCVDLPDIIVSDIAMPEMDGFQLLKHIKKHSDWENIPILFVTAYSSRDSRDTALTLGIDDYIVKPFQMDDLTVAIERKLK